MFSEDNTIEQMVLLKLQQNWWHYVPADELLVESMVKATLFA